MEKKNRMIITGINWIFYQIYILIFAVYHCIPYIVLYGVSPILFLPFILWSLSKIIVPVKPVGILVNGTYNVILHVADMAFWILALVKGPTETFGHWFVVVFYIGFSLSVILFLLMIGKMRNHRHDFD